MLFIMIYLSDSNRLFLRNEVYFVSLHIVLPFLKQMSAALSKLMFSFIFLFLKLTELAEFEIGLINYLRL